MTEPAPTIQPTLASPAERMFPTLTPAQVARIAAHGSVRPVRPGRQAVRAPRGVLMCSVLIVQELTASMTFKVRLLLGAAAADAASTSITTPRAPRTIAMSAKSRPASRSRLSASSSRR